MQLSIICKEVINTQDVKIIKIFKKALLNEGQKGNKTLHRELWIMTEGDKDTHKEKKL